ncbi:MAG: hypothetical protein KGI80_02525 [Verrucomicrobiota bacterium]|nr:hypothetical protein [Verrucomicrobiota bacterium]
MSISIRKIQHEDDPTGAPCAIASKGIAAISSTKEGARRTCTLISNARNSTRNSNNALMNIGPTLRQVSFSSSECQSTTDAITKIQSIGMTRIDTAKMALFSEQSLTSSSLQERASHLTSNKAHGQHGEHHESHESGFEELLYDTAASFISSKTLLPKTALFTYGSIKHMESAPLEAVAGGITHVTLDIGIETLCESITEAAIEAGVDSAALRAFIPKHSLILPVVAAHAARVAADIAIRRLPSEDPHPFEFDNPRSVIDQKIFLGLVSLPSKALQGVHHIVQEAITEGLHKIGVTDEQIGQILNAVEAPLRAYGEALLRYTDD